MTRCSTMRVLMTRFLAGVLLVFGLGHAHAAEERTREPFEIMRMITASQDRLQDRRGLDQKGLAAEQRALSTDFIDAARGDPKIWQNPRNRRALALFLLSGGDGAPLRQVVAAIAVEGDERKILDGALAFAEAREKQALTALDGLEPRNLPVELAGQVALTLGVLNLTVDRAKAMTAFDYARLLSPGALVEEAALRRQVFLASEGTDVARFVALSERYRARFPHSVYVDNFELKFREGFIKFWIERDDDARATLENALVDAPRQAANVLLFDTVRKSFEKRALAAAARAARRAKANMDANDPDQRRAMLYEFAANIFEQAPTLDQIMALDAVRLSLEDRILQESLSIVVAGLRPKPDNAPAQAGEPTPPMKKAQDLLAQAAAWDQRS